MTYSGVLRNCMPGEQLMKTVEAPVSRITQSPLAERNMSNSSWKCQKDIAHTTDEGFEDNSNLETIFKPCKDKTACLL